MCLILVGDDQGTGEMVLACVILHGDDEGTRGMVVCV